MCGGRGWMGGGGGAWQDSNFQRGDCWKGESEFSQEKGDCNFRIKSKLKSEIFNNKKVKSKNYFLP